MSASRLVILIKTRAARHVVICTKRILLVRLATVRCLSKRQQMAPERFHLRETNWLSCWLAPLADASRTKRWLLNGLTFGVCLALAGIVTFPDRRKSPISLCEITANPERY